MQPAPETRDQCINQGNNILMCDALYSYAAHRKAGFDNVVMRNWTTNQCRVAIVVGTNKVDKVELNFCPFCGANIVTTSKENPDDS